jgi:hypothetical protein
MANQPHEDGHEGGDGDEEEGRPNANAQAERGERHGCDADEGSPSGGNPGSLEMRGHVGTLRQTRDPRPAFRSQRDADSGQSRAPAAVRANVAPKPRKAGLSAVPDNERTLAGFII